LSGNTNNGWSRTENWVAAPTSTADLRDAELTEWDLESADLGGADLSHAKLRGANLDDARLDYAKLSAADLGGAKLNRTNLINANLDDAELEEANLNGAVLASADLSRAVLLHADLRGAYMMGTDWSQADLRDADLTGAYPLNADLSRTVFEAKSLPELRGIAGARNLELITYGENPDALVQLRKQFADGGFREQERKITYALKRKEAELAWELCKSWKTGDKTRAILWSSDSNLANCGSFILNRVFFDWTCQYGMSPGRPLSLSVLLWLLCSLLYFACIHIPGQAGLYRVYAKEIQENPSAKKRVERISPSGVVQMGSVRRLLQFLRRKRSLFCTAMFFSLMSAFNIGFRDINFGRWLRLLTRQEFDIKAVGWARVVAGW
jgi:Pentapeptide repeats (8 copies)